MTNNKIFLEKYQRIIVAILGILVVGLQFKLILTELNIDTEYAIAMAWRMLQGDFMFENMWEPHQTSAFLLAIIMKIYVGFTGTNDGIVIFINCVGALIHCLIAGCIYYGLKDRIDSFCLKLLCILFMTLHPKGFVAVTPEFTNMLVWFSVLLFLCLIKYYDGQNKKGWLILSSIFLCLQIISYPSCIIVYVFIVGVIVLFSKEKWKDIILFTVCCALQGSVYLLFFMSYIGINELIQNLGYILSGDTFHTQGGSVFGGLASGMKETLIWLGCCLVAAYTVDKFYQCIKRRKKFNITKEKNSVNGFTIFSIIVFCSEIILSIVKWYNGYDRTRFNIYLLIFILYSIKGFRYLNQVEKRMAFIGYMIAAGSVLGVCLLTNLSFTYAAGYAILAVILSFIPFMRWLQEHKAFWNKYFYSFLICMICVTLFRGYIDIREVEGRIKEGPAAGIVTDYMNADKNNRNVQDWEKYVKEGDSVLIVGQYSINALGYLLGDTETAVHSTMCNPTYNEILLEFWKRNPEKYPDVIAVASNSGNLSVNENSWIMQWIYTEYQQNDYVDGTYYRFYRLKE